MSALSTRLSSVPGLSRPQSAPEVYRILSSLSENLTVWRTICSGIEPATYTLLSHCLALVTSLSWNESPAHFQLHIILPSAFFYNHLHVALSPWRDLSTLFSSSGSQLLLSSLLQPHSLHVIFFPPLIMFQDIKLVLQLHFNLTGQFFSLSSQLETFILLIHSLSFILLFSFSSYLYIFILCMPRSSLITISLHSYLVSRCIYSSCIFSSEDSTTMQQ